MPTYDLKDQLLTATQGSGEKASTSSYTYDSVGNVTSVTNGNGKVTSYSYDQLSNLVERMTSLGNKETYTYDTLGQVENMTVSDGAGKELSKLSYTYDLAGNKLTSTETVDGRESQTRFTYDDHNRLTKLEGPDGTITYTYDQNGNRIASEKNSEKLDYIYDTENRLLAIKDKKGLLMAALYDGDDNRVFTASRKEGKNTYQLFQRKPKDTKSGRKSPYTAPSGEEHSLFWYGFSQNVLQALSALPQTIGSIWHSIFDDVSTAYHQKVAKDRATKEGIVVNPPELGNLPGQGEVTYASQVQDVLIPYTTREDSYNYYEERNYVNDVNREHTEVLETYDHDGKARETYGYGQGRASYLNNQTGDSYNYLTNQSGSVTGLTKDGQAVASTSYHLYGARKTSTDTTGNPFAYNGEARDDTGLDYLRARYYDSQGGTFLTEDSYPGEATDPLSQNRYSYVQNNPVNYTDPSGHFWNSIKKGWNYVKETASNAWNGVKRVASNTWNTVKRVASNTWNSVKSFASKAWNATKSAFNHATNWISTQYNRAVNWGSRQWNKVQTTYNSARDYVQTKYQQTVAQIEAKRQQVVRSAYALATGLSSSPTIREGLNLYRNWNTALQNTLKHVCNPKTIGASDKGETKVPSVADFRKYEDAARHGLRLDQKERIDRMTLEEYLKAPPMTPEENAYASNVKFAKFNQENKATLPTIAAELIGWNNGERLVTGKDPLTGEDANRWEAGAELAVDIASNFYPIAKAGKLRKLEKALDAVDAVNDASKAMKAADKANDASKATKAVDKASDAARVADKVDDVKDGIKINPLEDITFTDKVKKQMKQGDLHSFPEAVESFGSEGKLSTITGGDGIVRKKLEIPGSYKGKDGVFEYIIEPDNTVNHRFFRPKK